ncbi:hypothetical protein ASPTUDRAFT_55807 [Aspergillus tubingensis CBS 134.48]|uniref:Peptidase C1A papain C-terminal domain-containing protein n=1 Tax=Aspergillus tubingensis (strain CBS 134.48) TaxID=767770 RepID=A0A1L9N3D3_ASPTC|nr:hypothetical protein ASPTUDRAFT_55807 [Aspergillus tubingensis CBS 134.48]
MGLLVGEAWYLYLCVRPCSCALPALAPVHWWITRLAVPHERFHPLLPFDPGNDGEIGLAYGFPKQLDIGCQSGLERRVHSSKTPTIPSIRPMRDTNALFTSLLTTHIITLTCGVSCPRAPPDGLLFVPHQPEFKKEPYQCPERGHDGACWGVNAALFVNQEQAFSQLVQA